MTVRGLWIVVAISLGACERGGPRDPPTAGSQRREDAQLHVAVPRELDADARAAALDRLWSAIAKTERARSPVEAPVALTNSYVALQFAYGYARLGRAARARALVEQAMAGLGPARREPVHRWAVTAFRARIDQAFAGSPPEAPMPHPHHVQLGTFDRMTRYHLDRLREVSRILAAGGALPGLAGGGPPGVPAAHPRRAVRTAAGSRGPDPGPRERAGPGERAP